jgi:hypothetical protein
VVLRGDGPEKVIGATEFLLRHFFLGIVEEDDHGLYAADAERGMPVRGSMIGSAGEIGLKIHLAYPGTTAFTFRPWTWPLNLALVEVVGAVDIPAADFKTSDPYLRLSVTPGFNNQGKRTTTIESTLAPVWNETFTFVFGRIDGVAIQVVMWDVDEQDGDNKLSTLTIPLSHFSQDVDDYQVREYQMTPWKKYPKGGVLTVRVKLFCETPGVVGGLNEAIREIEEVVGGAD